MKNKKYSYPVLAAISLVLMITLGWVYLAYGTTIGTDISTGNLTSSGTVSGTWEGEVIAAGYGGTATDTSAWTGFLYVDSGTWGTSTIGVADLTAEDFGDFTCDGSTCDLDIDIITPEHMSVATTQDEYILTYESTGNTWEWEKDDDTPEQGDYINFVGGNYTTYNTSEHRLDLDAEIYTRSFTMISEATSTYNSSIQHSLPYNITIIDVMCSTADAGTTTIQLDERDMPTPNTGGVDIVTGGIECGTGLNPEPEFDNASIVGYNWINLDIDSVDGVNSTGTVRINVIYTIND